MADLRHLLAIYVHAHQTGNSVPPYIDADARAALAAEPPAPDPREALAARPLLEAVARLGDRIGQHTVGEIIAISDRAAAWLAENPPGQPVAIEPRGCPTPGACSCVQPTAPAPVADRIPDAGNMVPATAGAATLLRQPAPAPVPVPVADRPWERPGWCDAEGRCWLRGKVEGDWRLMLPLDSGLPQLRYCFDFSLPHWAIPKPPQGGEVEP